VLGNYFRIQNIYYYRIRERRQDCITIKSNDKVFFLSHILQSQLTRDAFFLLNLSILHGARVTSRPTISSSIYYTS